MVILFSHYPWKKQAPLIIWRQTCIPCPGTLVVIIKTLFFPPPAASPSLLDSFHLLYLCQDYFIAVHGFRIFFFFSSLQKYSFLSCFSHQSLKYIGATTMSFIFTRIWKFYQSHQQVSSKYLQNKQRTNRLVVCFIHCRTLSTKNKSELNE